MVPPVGIEPDISVSVALRTIHYTKEALVARKGIEPLYMVFQTIA